MQEVMFVQNGGLSEVNKKLREGWMVKNICAVPESVSVSVCGDRPDGDRSVGDVFAYIVLERK